MPLWRAAARSGTPVPIRPAVCRRCGVPHLLMHGPEKPYKLLGARTQEVVQVPSNLARECGRCRGPCAALASTHSERHRRNPLVSGSAYSPGQRAALASTHTRRVSERHRRNPSRRRRSGVPCRCMSRACPGPASLSSWPARHAPLFRERERSGGPCPAADAGPSRSCHSLSLSLSLSRVRLILKVLKGLGSLFIFYYLQIKVLLDC